MNSEEVKTFVLAYLRFKRQFQMVAVEFHYGLCDIIGLDKTGDIHDIEVKVSVADLKRDIKKNKHRRFTMGSGSVNYFSFAVPSDIEVYTRKYIDEFMPYAGLIVVDYIDHYMMRDGIDAKVPVRMNKKNTTRFEVVSGRLPLIKAEIAKCTSNNLVAERYRKLKIIRRENNGTAK